MRNIYSKYIFGGGALYSYNGRKERSPVYILVKDIIERPVALATSLFSFNPFTNTIKTT